MKIRKIIKFAVIIILVLALLLVGFIFIKGYQMYRTALDSRSVVVMAEEIRAYENFVSIDEINPLYIDAIVATEDSRFYSHSGLDIISVLRAVLVNIRSMSLVEGGSTITQQIAKNEYFTQEKRFERKVADMFMAFEIERHFSKKEILELYVNSIFFGNDYYGVREASLGYFGKEPKGLTDYESTMLAGIPNAPSAYALTANPDLASARQAIIIERLIEGEYITEEEAAVIQAEAVEVLAPFYEQQDIA